MHKILTYLNIGTEQKQAIVRNFMRLMSNIISILTYNFLNLRNYISSENR